MFEGFENRRIDVGETEINLRQGGDGPPVVLLHGYPQTHVIWHRVAPLLAERFSVVCPDLRGYGDSDCPATDDAHETYSKRAMAADIIRLMTELGHERFAVVGHDRGARVTYRMALDHPERIVRMASLDVVPTLDMWDATDKERAIGGFHWSFLAQPAPFPETMIGHDPDLWLERLHRSWSADFSAFDATAMAEYQRCFRKPEVIHATCEDYRAGATCDHAHDAADRASGRRVQCPVMCLWGQKRDTGGPARTSPLDVWRSWVADGVEVTGGPVTSGHFLAEEAAEAVLDHLLPFLSDGPSW